MRTRKLGIHPGVSSRRSSLVIVGGTLAALVMIATVGRANPNRPSPSSIVFDRGVDHIYILRPGGSVRFLTRGEDPDWSGDHKLVAFDHGTFARNPPSQDIYVIWANGKGLRRLTHSYPVQNTAPSFSPNGKQIAYVQLPPSGRDHPGGLRVINVDGTGRRVITTDGSDTEPAFSPNGKELAFIVDGRRHSLSIIRVSGGRPHAVLPRDSCPISSPSWAPDGRTIVFQGCGAPQTGPVICLVKDNGTHRRCLHNHGGSPAFSPTGKWIVYSGLTRGAKEALFKVHPNGTDTTRITPAAPLTGHSGDSDPDW
jgi:Tol biopolymer transport system component